MIAIVLSMLGAVSTVHGATCTWINGDRKHHTQWGKIKHVGSCFLCVCSTSGQTFCRPWAEGCDNLDDDACLQNKWSTWGGIYKCAENDDHCTGWWAGHMWDCCPETCTESALGRRLEDEEPAGEYMDESDFDDVELDQMTDEELAAFFEELGWVAVEEAADLDKIAVVSAVDDSTAEDSTNIADAEAKRRLAARLETNQVNDRLRKLVDNSQDA